LPAGAKADVVINTGPLVSLGRVEAFGVIERLPLAFIAPRQVADEIAAGIRRGYPVEMPSFVRVLDLVAPLNALSVSSLDQGEAAVIQLAIEHQISYVCIDDWRGRRAATAVHLRVTGSLGLLGRAKQLGLIPTVRPWIDKLFAAGIRNHPELVSNFLSSLGE
jgi:predicted nucleic acid-binding protein